MASRLGVYFARITFSGMEKENGVSSSDPDQPGLVEAQNRKLVIEDLLEQYFTDRGCAQERDDGKRECVQQKIAELSHQVVSRSESAQEQAWALQVGRSEQLQAHSPEPS